jgi:hypothetical protein
LVGQASLILESLVTIRFAVPRRLLGLVSGLGAGALVAAAGFERSPENPALPAGRPGRSVPCGPPGDHQE